MDVKLFIKGLFLSAFFIFSTSFLFAQSTVVSGSVVDAHTKRPMQYVTVSFAGTTRATNTDNAGRFILGTNQSYTRIKVSFIGYKDAYYPIVPGKQQIINAKLVEQAEQLGEVTVKSGKKPKYSNKNNPAVELIRQVIAHKDQNRPESYPYVEYKEYDKMVFSLANVSSKLSDKKYLQKYKFIIDDRDTVSVPGKSLLPIFLDENLSQVYYRKNPEKTKTTILGDKKVNFGAAIDNQGISGICMLILIFIQTAYF
jgi:hypothetical protein